MAKNKTVIAFDLYGTLLSTESIADELAKIYGEDKAGPLAALWRRYQLEYTWRINSMGKYKTFSVITRNALHHAVMEYDLTLTVENEEALMRSYDALRVFPEIPSALRLLEENTDSVKAFVFSNGTDEMIGNSVTTSPDLGPHAQRFESLISVDSVKCFKPDRRVYNHLVEQAGKQGHASDVWVVSANAFDIVGARAAGLRACFINRTGRGWIDRLDEERGAFLVVSGVDEAIESILKC
ncbi:haloacid dehalogenase [Annulohypoxylon bovei var. microspora]|nr:haloacid dehalogenase [Annulohypoxylon bovei var. microspora]